MTEKDFNMKLAIKEILEIIVSENYPADKYYQIVETLKYYSIIGE